jgi:hypothetical protein
MLSLITPNASNSRSSQPSRKNSAYVSLNSAMKSRRSMAVNFSKIECVQLLWYSSGTQRRTNVESREKDGSNHEETY